MTRVIVKGQRVPSESRSSMIRSAASLIGSRGANATSLSEVLDDSGAPRGSIYHHFPGGKNELTEDAARWTSERVIIYLSGATTESPKAVIEYFIDMWRRVVDSSNGSAGCAVAGVAVDTTQDQPLMNVVREIFRAWVALLSAKLEASGLSAERAVSVANIALAAMEGSLILCRAEGGSGPLEAVAHELVQLVS